MPTVRRLALLAATCLATLALLAPGPGPEDDRAARLRAMPVEERIRLAAKLKEFDSLPRDEQAAVRELDRAIAAEPEENRAIYYATLHRYHLWFHSLSESQKSELTALPPDPRLKLVTKILAEQHASRRRDPLLYQVADFGGISPYDLAFMIKVWLKLSPQEQATLAKAQDPDQRRLAILSYARTLRVDPVKRPSREAIDAATEKAPTIWPRPFLKKAEEKAQEKFKRRLGEYYYLTQHAPEKVKPDKLLQFNRALPSWLRSGIEDVPPEEARWLLTNLYRLIFPAPQEMEEPKPAAAATRGVAAAPKPTPGPATTPKPPPAKPGTPPGAPTNPF